MRTCSRPRAGLKTQMFLPCGPSLFADAGCVSRRFKIQTARRRGTLASNKTLNKEKACGGARAEFSSGAAVSHTMRWLGSLLYVVCSGPHVHRSLCTGVCDDSTPYRRCISLRNAHIGVIAKSWVKEFERQTIRYDSGTRIGEFARMGVLAPLCKTPQRKQLVRRSHSVTRPQFLRYGLHSAHHASGVDRSGRRSLQVSGQRRFFTMLLCPPNTSGVRR